MSTLTRDEILAALGPIEDVLVGEILATGASSEEFSEARSWIVNDEAPLNEGEPLPSGRTARLVDILASLEPEPNGDRAR